MCVEYVPLQTNQRLLFTDTLRLAVPEVAFKPSVFPLDAAPFIRRNPTTGAVECIAATFGLIPFWSRDRSIGRKTYNARSETVAEKPAYRSAWRQRHFGIAPMAAFYEPSWETGKAVRWRIEAPAAQSMGAAAIWDRWKRPDGSEELSFSLLTMNADAHPLMCRFHGPRGREADAGNPASGAFPRLARCHRAGGTRLRTGISGGADGGAGGAAAAEGGKGSEGQCNAGGNPR
jgi:putative SOS response-associated peptidase YedK